MTTITFIETLREYGKRLKVWKRYVPISQSVGPPPPAHQPAEFRRLVDTIFVDGKSHDVRRWRYRCCSRLSPAPSFSPAPRYGGKPRGHWPECLKTETRFDDFPTVAYVAFLHTVNLRGWTFFFPSVFHVSPLSRKDRQRSEAQGE